MTEPGMGRLETAYLRGLQAIGRRLELGTNVFDKPWDLLVVLDACRADSFAAIAPDQFEFDTMETIRSVGSSSSEWLEQTFLDRPETARTVMVTGNTWTDRYLDPTAFAAIDEVWKYAWDQELGTVPSDAITERAIDMARTHRPDRLVVHYMQPHHPFVPDPLPGDDGLARTGAHSNPANPWTKLRRGELSVSRVRAAYEANLRSVLEALTRLLENVSGEVVITADHGNLFGEWGLYGHPMELPIPAVRRVPWARLTATDRHTIEPTLEPPEPLPVTHVLDGTVTERLNALGYRED